MSASTATTLFSPFESPPPLVVEKSRLQREQVVDALNRAGFPARQAADSAEALREALSGTVTLVILDNFPQDRFDGIDLARKIQHLHPHCSFIFTSRRFSGADLSRLRDSHVRVEGAIEKPVASHWQELIHLVEKALIKVQVRKRLESVEERHLDPVTYLYALADLASFPQPIFDELLKELTAADEAVDSEESEVPFPLWDFEASPEMKGVATQIDEIYSQLRKLIRENSEDPGLATIAAPLRERLRELQEIEADAMERRFRQDLRFDPEKAQSNLEWAERLLGKK